MAQAQTVSRAHRDPDGGVNQQRRDVQNDSLCAHERFGSAGLTWGVHTLRMMNVERAKSGTEVQRHAQHEEYGGDGADGGVKAPRKIAVCRDQLMGICGYVSSLPLSVSTRFQSARFLRLAFFMGTVLILHSVIGDIR